jgi:hypothetical protein
MIRLIFHKHVIRHSLCKIYNNINEFEILGLWNVMQCYCDIIGTLTSFLFVYFISLLLTLYKEHDSIHLEPFVGFPPLWSSQKFRNEIVIEFLNFWVTISCLDWFDLVLIILWLLVYYSIGKVDCGHHIWTDDMHPFNPRCVSQLLQWCESLFLEWSTIILELLFLNWMHWCLLYLSLLSTDLVDYLVLCLFFLQLNFVS